jgi:deoxyribose-phosphate aldolase
MVCDMSVEGRRPAESVPVRATAADGFMWESTEPGGMTLPGRIDHTVLGPATTGDDVLALFDEAMEFGTNVCIPPCYVDMSGYAPNVTVATVVGFPHGQHATSVKCAEAERAWLDGADEIDLVANAGFLLGGEDDRYREDIESVVASVPLPVKVIVEAPSLTDDQLHRACELAVEADADYLKTATGFGDGGATVADVELMSEYLPVKASGGIGSWADAKAMLDAGAERIGASSGDVIVREWREVTADDGVDYMRGTDSADESTDGTAESTDGSGEDEGGTDSADPDDTDED